ncbi:ComF family protein [Sungkyunkwania multivorans]|uniref:ComF family protein n=1 Tax=Sungkyunkwania multivorans TaxID=1173618 RepID=A0ABW3D2Z9_9FLAO
MINILNNILSVFFPEVCLACKHALISNEKHICTTCRHELPQTEYHAIKNNSTAKVLYGRVRVENATSLFFFQKDSRVQQLMHLLKYKGHEEISFLLGKWLGAQLKEVPYFDEIDIVIPVPLHPRRQRKRGYNQVTGFGKELSSMLNSTFDDSILYRTRFTKKMVFKKRLDRWQSLENSFQLTDESSLVGKHILLVDDVITTGATLESCANALLKVPGVKISVATMAITV